MSDDRTDVAPPGGIDYIAVEESPPFQELKRKQRSFIFPMAAFFLVWYFVYVLLAAYAHDFMATPVFGSVNIGLLMGLGQFVTTFVITMWYVSYANKTLDPRATAIREELEKVEVSS